MNSIWREVQQLANRFETLDVISRSLTLRAIVRLENTEDAHRLVRYIHKTEFPGTGAKAYEIRAKVVY